MLDYIESRLLMNVACIRVSNLEIRKGHSMNINQNINAYTDNNPYDYDNKIILHQYPKMIIENIEKCGMNHDVKLLELGLGHGYSAKVFSKVFGNYTVLDGDEEIINSFTKKNKELQIKIIHTFFEDFEAPETYDVIVAGFVLEHVDDPLLVLKKYKKMVKSGGRFFIAVPNAEALNRRLGFEAGLLDDLESLSQADKDLGHKRYFTIDSITKLCNEAAMKISKVEGIYLKPFTTRQILSLNLSSDIIEAMCKVGKAYPELCLGILVECEI